MQKHTDKGFVEYKSNLELKSFKYCDYNQHIKSWSAEPFAIPYIKPTDFKTHRYYPDLFIEFSNGKKFLVEVKHSSETRTPRKPKKVSAKSEANYNRAMQTWFINQAKWAAAEHYCQNNNMKFIILTEKELL